LVFKKKQVLSTEKLTCQNQYFSGLSSQQFENDENIHVNINR